MWAPPRRHKRFKGKRNKVAGGKIDEGCVAGFFPFAYEIAGLVLIIMGMYRK